jgi:hypothetical protein
MAISVWRRAEREHRTDEAVEGSGRDNITGTAAPSSSLHSPLSENPLPGRNDAIPGHQFTVEPHSAKAQGVVEM